MKILFAGIIARYPFGGVTWCSLITCSARAPSGTGLLWTRRGRADPVLDTRSLDLAWDRLHQAGIEPFGWATDGRS